MQSKRVVLISTGVPDARDGASLVIIHNFIENISRQDVEILHVILQQKQSNSAKALRSYQAAFETDTFRVETLEATKFVTQGWKTHVLNVSGDEPAITSARAFSPDLVIAFDFIPAWVGTLIPSKRKLAWLGDLAFQTTFYHGLYGWQEKPWALISFAKYCLAAEVWRRAYAEVLRKYDEVIVSAASSVAQVSQLGVTGAHYLPFPWPVIDEPAKEAERPAKPSFMFFGNLFGLGSRSALHFMVNEVYGRLLEEWGKNGFEILLAGRGDLPRWFDEAISDKPEFVLLGFVEDLPAVLAKCHAVLVPIDVPVGNRTRILYGLSHSLLVIAHKNVALGNSDLVDGETCALSTTGKDFAAQMKRAVDDRAWAETIATAGHQMYLEKFHPNRAGPNFVARVNLNL